MPTSPICTLRSVRRQAVRRWGLAGVSALALGLALWVLPLAAADAPSAPAASSQAASADPAAAAAGPNAPAHAAAPVSAAPSATDAGAGAAPGSPSSTAPVADAPAAAAEVQSAPVRGGSVQGTPVAQVRPAQARPTPVSNRPHSPPPTTRPLWDELTEAQRAVLQPLAASWNTTNESQKRKWLTLSNQFHQLSADERGRLQARMGEWSGLTSQQRSAARLNFAQARSMSVSEMQLQWEAYQALSEPEKRRLADAAQRKPSGAAVAVTPVPRDRLATLQGPAVRGGSGKAVLSASAFDPVTLLPAAASGSRGGAGVAPAAAPPAAPAAAQ